ncbi:hypothetical protein C0585_04920 [Candidatus Woesearchaeota archaeon]|nr:MAG: hypothetical protein C0585_04920 [Candidatus Woesearchaeota archaeon]
MKIKVLNQGSDGQIRLESKGTIKEVMINEDFFHPEDETIAIGFKGRNTSGLIEFTSKELEELLKEVKKRTHLIKDFKVLKE